jgi:inosose dehydratase
VIRVANAPVSYGAFELTVGVLPNVPGPEEVLDAIAAAGYEGTELGPLGYLGHDEVLRERLESRGLDLVAAFIQIQGGELDASLDVVAEWGAKPVLADAGPRDGAIVWDEIARAADRARARGLEPAFHHHMGTRVQTTAEIEELLARTDVGLVLDTGHLTAAGGDPARALRDWHDRIDHLHVKDVRLDVLHDAADWPEAWRRGVFCELGTGDVDLDAFFAELDGYAGWLVVEQDWVPGPGDEVTGQVDAQARNRRWLSEHVGI